jgi:hypothetical protein
MHWYGIPEGDEYDIEDPAVIRAANPLSTIDPRDIIRSCSARAPTSTTSGVSTATSGRRRRAIWLPTGAWGKLADDELEIPDGADIYVGVDVAHSYDTTAVAWAWRAPDGRIVVRCHVWSVRPEAPAHEHVDDFYNHDAEHLAELFILRARRALPDPRGRRRPELLRHRAPPARPRFETAPLFPQSKEMTEYVQEFYRLVDAKAIAHDGDRVSRRLHMAAIAGEKDSNGYWRIRKLNTPNPMDAGTATIIAVGRCGHAPEPVEAVGRAGGDR